MFDEHRVPVEDRYTADGFDRPTVLLPDGDTVECGLIEVDPHGGGVYVRFRGDDLPGQSPTTVVDLTGDQVAWLVERLSAWLATVEEDGG